MNSYICSVCGFLYDIQTAQKSVEGNLIPFEELPDDWVCPICGISQELFIPTKSTRPPDLPADNPDLPVKNKEEGK